MRSSNMLCCKELTNYISFSHNINVSTVVAPKWEECYTCFAAINSLNNSSYKLIDTMYFANINYEKLFLFKLRYSSIPNINMQIRFNNRWFAIKKIINIEEKNKILHIITLEI